ncbi:MAG TPA: PAS domain S-box protein [Candidatus Sulfopaludibacter sp.]|nr:PAS domain S-box protein [Candidatus Sulfopaludibacter sp.]
MGTDLVQRLVHILHLEDSENDQILVREMLHVEGLNCEFVPVKTREDFNSAVRQNKFDLIISDYTLPSFDGLHALSLAREVCPETPFIFFSGTIGEEAAVESLRNGAVDYVLKQQPSRLGPAVRRALRNRQERALRKQAESALHQSEERFRIVARATNDVVWEWDIKTNKMWFGGNFQAVFGHSREDVDATLEWWLDLIHPDEKARVTTGMSTLLASGGRVWWDEHRVRRANGSYAQVLERASVIYDETGKPQRMVGVTIDMSERKQAEEKIREQAALLDKARDAIIVADLKERIVYWNQSAERIYGWSAAEVMGKTLPEVLFHGEPPPELEGTIKSVKERSEWNGELHELSKDGRPIIVQGRSTVIRDEHDQPKSLLIINTDITERKMLEEQFLRAQRLESLGVLVSGIAHDLNNSLSPILMGVEVVREEITTPETESILDTMRTSARRSADMVKQMLTFVRGGEAKKHLIHAAQLVREMGRIINDTFPKSIQCRVRVDKSCWPIRGLPTPLHQVLLNLCVNARDAMPDGGTLTLSVNNVNLGPVDVGLHPDARPGDYLCVSVADTGTGIPAEHLKKIFEPFFTTKAPGKGTGLGLSTSLNIIKTHDGFITVHSEEGRGTEFKCYFPAATETPEETAAGSISLPPGNGECVLIVDDEEAILAIVRSTLENYGYQVLTAGSGLEAIARFTRNSDAVHLIITDLAMPFMDGRAVIQALRKIRSDVKIIVASGSEREVEELRKDVRTDAFIPKPFTNEVLLKVVHQVLSD